jgi:hypothetical protein
MSFFDSEIVRKEAQEITDLQQEIIKFLPNLLMLPRDDKLECIDKMLNLIEKQKIFYNRISLSDDPRALDLKDQFVKAARMLGMTITGANMNQIYDNFSSSMEEMKRQVLDGTL